MAVLSPTPEKESLVFGPEGVGPLRLGMTRQQVTDTHSGTLQVGSRHDGWPAGCWVLHYRANQLGRTRGDTLNGALSERHGLELLYATPRMVAPEGIRIGSTILEVRKAYDRPDLTSGDLLRVPASDQAIYRIQLAGVVTSMTLEMRDLDCTI